MNVVKRLQLVLHVLAELEVERGERFVEQKHSRVVDERAGDGDALLLAARQSRDGAALEAFEVDESERVLHPLYDLFFLDLRDPQTERDVFKHVEMREKRVTLENCVDVALVRRHVVYTDAVEEHVAGVGALESADYTQSRRLAAARRAEQSDELLVTDIKVDVVEHRLAVVGFTDILQIDDFRLFHKRAP